MHLLSMITGRCTTGSLHCYADRVAVLASTLLTVLQLCRMPDDTPQTIPLPGVIPE